NGDADIPGDPLTNRHGHAGGAAVAVAAGADVKVGLVEGQGFDLVAVVVEDGAHAPGRLPVLLEAVGEDDEVGAQGQGGAGRHGGADTVAARLVVAGGDHAAPLRRAAHRHGAVAQGGVVAHFDRGEKAVGVAVDD